MATVFGPECTAATGDSWKANALKFEKVRWEAESASQYDSHDPLKHGADDGRAVAKIQARAKLMQSMKGGFLEDDDAPPEGLMRR